MQLGNAKEQKFVDLNNDLSFLKSKLEDLKSDN